MNPKICLAALLLAGCNLTKTVKVPLPPFESQIVVECYLESGKQLRALVTRTNSFFDTALIPSPAGSSVSIQIADKSYRLRPQVFLDTVNNKFYNYVGDFYPLLPPGTRCKLRVTDERGGPDITAETTVMPVVKIDSVFFKFTDPQDTLAYLGVYIKDQVSERNFYRVKILSVDSQDKVQKIDFSISDASTNGQTFPVITRPRYLEGKEVFVFLYHLSPDYYDFLNTIDEAKNFTSGNPFFQPALIKSNTKGGIGIFTALSYDTRVVKIER